MTDRPVTQNKLTVGQTNTDLLLHVCCGPCAEWPVKSLLDEGFSLTAFFSNPNIHPAFEQKRRREYAQKLMNMRGIPFLSDELYMEDEWKVGTWEEKYDSRCQMCYAVRMQSAARKAKELGIRAFTTTLLVSPYQDHQMIVSAAEAAASQEGIAFVYRDFRIGYREGQSMAKEDGLYRQKYCGCIYSLNESAFKDKIYKSFEGSDGETKTVL